MKSYSFYFNTSDWLASPAVKMMSKAERGAYIGLLASAWESPVQGTLPASEDKVRRLAEMSLDEWAESGETLLEKFPLSECGTYRYNPRLLAEAGKERVRQNKSAEYLARKAEAGSKGGRVRAEREAAAKAKGAHTKEEWGSLLRLCGAQCVRCGSTNHVQKDHITPIYQGGSDGISNLQPLCRTCNTSKGPENIDYRLAYFEANAKQCLGDFQALLGNSSSTLQAIQVKLSKESTNVDEKAASIEKLEMELAALKAQAPAQSLKANPGKTLAAAILSDPDDEQRWNEGPLTKPKAFRVICERLGFLEIDFEHYRRQALVAAEDSDTSRTITQWTSWIRNYFNNQSKHGPLLKLAAVDLTRATPRHEFPPEGSDCTGRHIVLPNNGDANANRIAAQFYAKHFPNATIHHTR